MCSFIQNETPHIIDSCKIILLKSYREVRMFFRALIRLYARCYGFVSIVCEENSVYSIVPRAAVLRITCSEV